MAVQSYNSSNPNFIVESLIGSGTFGQVYKVFDNNSQQYFAIKRTMKKGCKVSREFKILQEVRDCENCVHLIDIFYTLKQKDLIQNLVFEYFPQSLGIMIRNIYKKRRFEYSEIYCIMKQVLLGLEYIHSKSIIHRDIKPDNILLSNEFPYKVKLCDFGSAKKICEKNTPYIVSRYYRAPELIFCAEKYDAKVDIWSAGCIFLELFTGFPVFRGNNDGEQFVKIADIIGPPLKEDVNVLTNVRITSRAKSKIIAIGKKHDLKELFSDHQCPEVVEDLINRMLEWNPKKRFSASQCLNHDYFIADTALEVRRDFLKFLETFAPKKYSTSNKGFFTVTLVNQEGLSEMADATKKLNNSEFKYNPQNFRIDDGELLRKLNILCIPESFGYPKSVGEIVFPNFTYPKCWQKTHQNGSFIHIDRTNNLMYMDCPDNQNGHYLTGPVDQRKIVKGHEVFFKWDVKEYKKPVDASNIEFALGSCGSSSSFMQGTMNPIFKPEAYSKAKKNTKGKPKLIFFLTLDSMSRRHLFRKVPKVIDLMNRLNKNSSFSVFDFKIHNILGADSISNQVPIFGGLEKFVRDFKGKQDIDYLGSSSLWSILREKGFISFLGLENCDNYFPGSLGRMPEVDYAVGPFYCAVQKYSAMKFEKSFEKTQRCLGGHHTHYYILNYTNSVIDLNPGVSHFLYIHLNAAHEASGQHAATLNDDLSEYLEEFLKKYQKNYEVFIYLNGDHGMRYGNWFTDAEAYQENKLPSLFIIASKSLLDRFPYSYFSLKTNSERLTSKLDLRETTLALAGIEEKTKFSINLLEDLASVNRKCEDCAIEAWDCACNKMVLIENPSEEMKAVLDRLLNIAEKTINVDSYSNPKYPIGKYCKFIRLTKILRVYHVKISNIQEFFKLEIESDSRKGMIFQVNYFLTSSGNVSKRNGYHSENIIFNAPVIVKVTAK